MDLQYGVIKFVNRCVDRVIRGVLIVVINRCVEKANATYTRKYL